MKKIYALIAMALLVCLLSQAQHPQALSQKAVFKSQLKSGSAKAPRLLSEADLVTVPEGVTIESDWIIKGTFKAMGSSADEEFAAQVAFDGDDVYIQGLAYFYEDAWLKGQLIISASGTKAVFPSGQYVGTDGFGDEFMCGTNDYVDFADIVFSYDEENQTFTLDNHLIENKNANDYIDYWGSWDPLEVYKGDLGEVHVVIPPAGLVAKSYAYNAQELHYNASTGISFTDYSADLNVGFDGDDVYIQGLCNYLPEAWVKGSKNGDKYEFEIGQYFGSYFGVYDMYLLGVTADNTKACNVVMSYDASSNEFVQETSLLINGKPDEPSYYNWYYVGSTITGSVTGVADVNASKTVATERYYNLAGQASANAHDGMNIVVRTYTDGTRSVEKVVR